MKKITTVLVLLFVLSVSVFADGVYGAGGKSCPQGQTCLFDGNVPADGKSDSTDQTGETKEDSIFENVLDFLKSIF